MSNMDLRFGRLGTFNTKILKSRTTLKWLFFVSSVFVLVTAVFGIILISLRPEFNLVKSNETIERLVGFYKVQITDLTLKTMGSEANPAHYLSYSVTNVISTQGIVYVGLASFSLFFNVFMYLMVRFYKSHNTVNYHLIISVFTIMFTILYILVMAVGLSNKANNQTYVNYDTVNYYEFNFTYAFSASVVDTNSFIFNYRWTMGSLAYVGTMISLIVVLSVLFVWFASVMLVRQPHFRYDIYYTIYDSDKQKRGI